MIDKWISGANSRSNQLLSLADGDSLELLAQLTRRRWLIQLVIDRLMALTAVLIWPGLCRLYRIDRPRSCDQSRADNLVDSGLLVHRLNEGMVNIIHAASLGPAGRCELTISKRPARAQLIGISNGINFMH